MPALLYVLNSHHVPDAELSIGHTLSPLTHLILKATILSRL